MKTKLLFFVAATLVFSNTSFGQKGNTNLGQKTIKKNCGTMEYLDKMITKDPRILKQMDDIERHTEHFVKHYDNQSRAEAIISIPVVVHVVYNTTAENISTAQIQSQITALTADFRRTNADRSNTPAAFASLAADTKIEFCLATIDPDGNATTGITRTSTTKTYFTTNNAVKYDAYGGKNAWTTSKYLNLWVCDLGSNYLGYAQFPGSGSAATDGVVIHYKYFGKGYSTYYPYNKGRTASHEVGHWLNLRHIWGDSYCGNDYVSDTPTQQYESGGCPSYPRTTCSSSDMFMNYMDYTDDRCMNMFSNGQKARMRAQFGSGGYRQGLLTSTGCGGGTTTPAYCASKGNDASYEWVANVTVGSINNSTGNNGGYVDLTSISTDLEKDKSYSVSLSPGFSGSTYNEYWKIWIDYNQDKDFDDVGELVYDAGSMSSSTVTGNFTVSSGATNGATRMRVSMKYNAAQTTCETFSYGEVEDYTVNIIDAVATCDIPSGLSASSITDNSATMSWSSSGANSYNVRIRQTGTTSWSTFSSSTTSKGVTGLSASTTYEFQVRGVCTTLNSNYSASTSFTTSDPPCNTPGGLTSSSITETSATTSWSSTGASSYDVRYRQSGTSTWSNTSTTTTSKGLSGLSSSTAYEWQVRGVCSSTNISSYSAQASFTTSDPPVAAYCSSKGNDASYEWIAGVAVGTINNSTGNNGGYADFTSISTDLEKGASISFTLTPGFSGSTYSEYWKIWIDLNQDMDFADAGELVYDQGAMSSSAVSGSFTVPTSALNGATRIRVTMKYNSAPSECETFSYGEVEDYTVNITDPAPTYCGSQGNDASYEWIARVVLGSIDESSGNDGGYIDRTSISTNLTVGSSNTVTLYPGFSGSTYNEYWKIYIDFNGDGDFTDAGETAFDAGGLYTSGITGTLIVPAGVSTGTKRMRVSMKYNGAQSSCESFSYGEVEDYTVNIVSGKQLSSIAPVVSQNLAFRIYPNPTSDVATIDFEIEDPSNATLISVYDIHGKLLMVESIDINGTALKYSMNFENLPGGIYSIMIQNGTTIRTKKLVLAR